MFATQKQLEATAELLARMAHSDQVDQATDRYIEHLTRVVARIPASQHLDRAAAWLYGVVEDTSVTLDDLRGVVSIHSCETLEKAVHAAAAAARPGEVVLLAPACSSFDQFESYEHRGRVFKQLVKDLQD